MRCLSLWQPFASLMVGGFKRVETRGDYFAKKFTPGALLIHAAKKWDGGLYDVCTAAPFREALAGLGHLLPVPQPRDRHPPPARMPFGAVVGVVNVLAVLPTDRVKWNPDSKRFFAYDQFSNQLVISSDEKAFGDYSDGRIAVVTDRPYRFAKPIPLTGRQGFFAVPDELVEAALAGWDNTPA